LSYPLGTQILLVAHTWHAMFFKTLIFMDD